MAIATVNSRALLAAPELAAELGVGVKDALLKLVRDDRVARERLAGLFLYCSRDAARRRQLLASRHAALPEEPFGDVPRPTSGPSDETRANRGHVSVGVSHDTPQFAVRALATWWARSGRLLYPQADHLLVLADNGGSNGSRTRAWKIELQTRICDHFNVSVTVCHFPPGTSKWNPIEHRLFSEISKNWAGHPLDSYETVLNHLRSTKTRTGLRVRATLDRRSYETGRKITAADMAVLHLKPHRTLPSWNYTLTPASVSA